MSWRDRATPVAAGGGWRSRATPVSAPAPEAPGVGEAAWEGVKQGATLGFGDELAGAVTAGLQEAANALPRGSLEGLGISNDYPQDAGDAYRAARNEARAQDAAAQAAHPVAHFAGNVAGTALALARGPLKAAPAALVGGISGLGGSDADLTTGDPANYARAVFDTGVGAALGKAGEKVAPVVGKVLGRGAQAAADAFDTYAGKKAFKALNPQLADFRALGKDATERAAEIGNRAMDIVGEAGFFGRNVGELSEKLSPAREAAGEHLADVYRELDQAAATTRPTQEMARSAGTYRVPLSELDDVPAKAWQPGRSAQIDQAAKAGKWEAINRAKPIEVGEGPDGLRELNDGNHRLQWARENGVKELPVRFLSDEAASVRARPRGTSPFPDATAPLDASGIRGEHVADAIQRVADKYAGNPVTTDVGEHLGALADRVRQMKAGPISFADAEGIKQALGEGAQWHRGMDPLLKTRADAYRDAYMAVKEANEAAADAIHPDLGSRFRAAKELYGSLAPAAGAAERGAAREARNRGLSLSDSIAGAAGMGGHAAAGEDALASSVKGLGLAALHKAARTRGNSALAVGARTLADILEGGRAGPFADYLIRTAAQSPAAAVAAHYALMGHPRYGAASSGAEQAAP